MNSKMNKYINTVMAVGFSLLAVLTVVQAYPDTATSIAQNKNVGDNAIQQLINLLTSRVSILENSQTAVVGMVDTMNTHTITPGGSWQQILSYNFTMPYNGYANIDSGGEIFNYGADTGIEISVDSTDPNTPASVSTLKQFGYCTYYCDSGFQTSRVYSLAKGNHTVYLNAFAYQTTADKDGPYMRMITLSITMNNKGSLIDIPASGYIFKH